MKGVASLEARPQVVARLRLGGRAIDSRPLWRQFRAMLEAPVRVGQCDRSADGLFTDVIEQAATYHFANLSFIVYQQILGDSLDDFGDAFLPFRVHSVISTWL